MTKSYKNLIFTDHAYHRLKQRSISEFSVYQTINQADKTNYKNNNQKFIKTINGRKIHIVAKFNKQQNKWVVISVWVRGEEDKNSLVWQIISLPFKLIYYLLAKIATIILSHNKKSRRHR